MHVEILGQLCIFRGNHKASNYSAYPSMLVILSNAPSACFVVWLVDQCVMALLQFLCPVIPLGCLCYCQKVSLIYLVEDKAGKRDRA